MSVLEIKQAITRLSNRERREVHAYLLRMNHDTPEWKRATAKRLKAMRAGRRVSAVQLEARMARGAAR